MQTTVEVPNLEKDIRIAPALRENNFRETKTSTHAYNKGWQRYLSLYERDDVSFSERVRFSKIHALIDAILESNEARWDLKWILLEYCLVSINHNRGGEIKKCPFIKQKVFCRGLLAHVSLSLALLKARPLLSHDCYLILTDLRKFRACITITKPKCL